MGLWLKCPKCQASNPLSQKACISCGASLENLSMKERVYVVTPSGSPPPEKAAPPEPVKPTVPPEPVKPTVPPEPVRTEAPPVKEETKVEPQPGEPGALAWEAEGPPPKKAKGPKAKKKK
jgi:hypothetical protein